MKRSLVLVPVVALGLSTVPAAAQAANSGRPYHLVLTGAAERPGPGDPDGTGTAHLTVNPGQGEVCYSVTVSGVDPITAAHIHVAPETSPGPIVIPLAPFQGNSTSGCADVDRDLALALIQNPENYYLNVHNATFPPGALRAQLG
jgi:CHRD domain